MENIKLNLGCGYDYREGYINIDIDPKNKADLHIDILDFGAQDYSVSEILMSHVAMYIRPEEMSELLKRCHAWLKRGGKLDVETIDLDIVMDYATNPFEGKVDSYGLTNIFGTEKTGPHRWGWTKEALTKQLLSVGFEVVGSKPGLKKPNRDFRLIAIK